MDNMIEQISLTISEEEVNQCREVSDTFDVEGGYIAGPLTMIAFDQL